MLGMQPAVGGSPILQIGTDPGGVGDSGGDNVMPGMVGIFGAGTGEGETWLRRHMIHIDSKDRDGR